MVESVTDECKNPDDGPQNMLDAFNAQDKQRILELMHQLPAPTLTEDRFEEMYEEYSEVLGKYQEQPHLLDSSLEELVQKVLGFILDPERSQLGKHRAAKFIYQMCKVRTFKAFQKYLPHEIRYLSFVLSYLEQQDLEDWKNWETRFLCLLWLSILVLNPFDLSRLDGNDGGKSTMLRIYEACKINCLKEDTCTPIAAYLVSKFLIRNDVKKVYLEDFLEWANMADLVSDPKIGPLSGIACVLKHGKREDLLPFAEKLANTVLHQDYGQITKNFKIYKICIKISQRIGMIMLPPRIAKWRYQRGARSLLSNIPKEPTETAFQREAPKLDDSSQDEAEYEDDEEVPAEIEEIIERLLLGLKGNATIVRWSSAKGIGRITNRLPKTLGDEVVSSVIELINPMEQDAAWHGACLALAELARRGLLLPHRLNDIIPLLLQALVYDEMLGYRNVGQNIRDAACYMCWAFARAFHSTILQPFVEQIASALLVTAVFDREINCRRAASAAFQESVGRLGNFPHGIDILTMADFFSVAVRSNAFLQISDYIAQFDEYRRKLIDHLIERKINHWDTNIRELSALALSNFTRRDPVYMRDVVLPTLFDLTETTDLNARHGATLAIGEVILSLRRLCDENDGLETEMYISKQIIERGGQLVIKFRQRGQFKGMSGSYMKHGCASFIRNCSEAELALSHEQIESWQLLLDESVIDEKATTRELAVQAFSAFCTTYYRSEDPEKLTDLIDNYLRELRDTKLEHKAQGIASVLGALPKFMLELKLDVILAVFDEKTILPEMFAVGYNHSEMRRDCIKGLANIVKTVGFDNDILNLDKVYNVYMRALEEYAIDNRGDIGSWVREAGINALFQFLTCCPSKFLTSILVQKALIAIAKQSVERIDKIRAVAGKTFVSLLYNKPEMAHIAQKTKLCDIFPEDTTEILWLFPHHTFPLFIQLLDIPEYVNSIAEGLILSVGAPTESLHSCAAKLMNDYLKNHEQFIPFFGATVLKILQGKTTKDTLFMTSTFQFISELLASATNTRLLLSDKSSDFPEAIFTVVNDLVIHSKKHFNSIPVYCALMLAPRICKRVLSKLVMYLGMLCVNIRRETALKMFETLLVYGEQTCIPEENLEEVLACLSEEKWDGELEEARRIRNHLCMLMGIKPPVVRAKN
ncbi:tubulin-specific chaperone D [Malaya genurostris]|uniref:tubulin-specific chaperone D n=1 Tax=Malaya genurostris TaxID=325434 RepID=UPI0026F3D3C5|nr:tubulin-specific chaperone D [Malaya genurostris]